VISICLIKVYEVILIKSLRGEDRVIEIVYCLFECVLCMRTTPLTK